MRPFGKYLWVRVRVALFIPDTKETISRKLKAARELAKRNASDQKEKTLHEDMQRVSESSVEFPLFFLYLSILSF